jgi:hypothetical protein
MVSMYEAIIAGIESASQEREFEARFRPCRVRS